MSLRYLLPPIFGSGGLLWLLRGELCKRGLARCKPVPTNEAWADTMGATVCAYCYEPREGS